MNIERPPYGYYCEVKVHDTKRPKPDSTIREYPTIDKLPEDAPLPKARFNGRWFWQS